LPDAAFNVVLSPEIAAPTAQYLQRTYAQPMTKTVPIGIGATRAFIAEVVQLAGLSAIPDDIEDQLRAPWYSRSVDSTYLTGKRVFIFGDASHALAAAKIATEELGFTVVGIGTYTREFARDVRAAAEALGVKALIADDYLDVEARIVELQPELVLGTQMERHIAKRLGIPCAVISSPVHVQDFPARRSPQMGIEGANVIFDTWVHPLMMGLEEHLLALFRDDFEFNDARAPSHLGGQHKADTHERAPGSAPGSAPITSPRAVEPMAQAPKGAPTWATDAEAELKKIPFFVRGKARRNTESFAIERKLDIITLETLYDAKAHFSR
jgi:light-independent protochlorophyllide reductase subunit B